MFRTDRDALAQQVEDLRRERAELQSQNEAMRDALLVRQGQPPRAGGMGDVYKGGIAHLSPGERVALASHGLEAFPVWALLLLGFFSFGLFPLYHLNQLHDRLPRAANDEPSAARGFWFTFIPYFNLYWIVFNTARLADRLNLQFRLRGLPDGVPRVFAITAAVLIMIPYLNVLAALILWPIAAVYFQRAANDLAALEREGASPVAAAAAAPRVRVPRVQDLPGPDDVVEHQAEIEADEAARAHSVVR